MFILSESLNEVTQTCGMDLYVRYWDVACSQVKMRYFGSSFISHGTYTDILQHCVEITNDLNPAHLYQTSMDGPNVNQKFYREFVEKRKDENYHSLIDIRSCGLHVIHGSLGNRVDDSQLGLKKLMKGAYQLFHDTLPVGMIMKASRGHDRIPSASVLVGKVSLGFEVTHD